MIALARTFRGLLRPAAICSLAAIIVACSSSSTSSPPPTSGGDAGNTTEEPDAEPGADAAPQAPFKLTSSEITEGASFPADNTCTGKNRSPSLAWGPGPAGTKSYAVVLNDTTISFLHAITYDIPADVLALPANLQAAYAPAEPAGAHTTKNYKGQFGYAGPCPPNEHVYEFVLYALDVAKLPDGAQDLALADAETAIQAHMLKSTKLTAKYKKP